MTFKLHRISILTLLVALVLAACGQAPPQSWPGLARSADGSTLYVALNTHVYALDANANGAKRWQFPADNSNLGPFQSDPAVTDSMIIVTSVAPKGKVYALDMNGLMKWEFSESQDRLIAPATIHGDRVYVPSADHTLYVLDLNGNRQWTYKAGGGLWGGVLVTDDLVYVPSMDHHLYALDTATGAYRWDVDLKGALASAPALGEDLIYVGTLADTLYALDASTGAQRWMLPAEGWVWGTPLVAGDTLYFGDLEGQVYSVNSQDGSIHWNVQPSNEVRRAVRGTLALVDDSLIVTTENGFVFSLDVNNGATRWPIEIDGRNADRLLSNPIIAGDTVIIAPLFAESQVYALNLANGDVRWMFKP